MSQPFNVTCPEDFEAYQEDYEEFVALLEAEAELKAERDEEDYQAEREAQALEAAQIEDAHLEAAYEMAQDGFEDFGYDASDFWDYEPSPYDGTYSEM